MVFRKSFFDIHKSVKSETRTGRRPNRVIESFQKEQAATPEAGLFGEKDRNVMKKLLPSLNDDSWDYEGQKRIGPLKVISEEKESF